MIMALRRIMEYCGQFNSYIRLYNPLNEDQHPESWGGYTSEVPPKIVRAINNASCVFDPSRSKKTMPTTSTYLKRVMHANNIQGRSTERPTFSPSNLDTHKNKPTREQYTEKRRHTNQRGDEGAKRQREHQCPATVTSEKPKTNERGVTTEEVQKMMEPMKADILHAIKRNKTSTQNESIDIAAPLHSTPIRQITDQLRPKRKPKIYVFGESHINRKNECDLETTIPSLNVELAEYVSVGGGIYNDISDKACQALRKQDFGDSVVILMGSNDVRWLADKKYKKRKSTANGRSPWEDLDKIFRAARTSKGMLFINKPIPSPCNYRREDRKNVWCKESPCQHEKKSGHALKELANYIIRKTQGQGSMRLIDLMYPFILSDSYEAYRQCFRPDNVHLTQQAASSLSSKVMQKLREYYKPARQ